MSHTPQGAIDALLVRAQSDAALRERLIADPKSTIEAETGMTVPADWAIVARDNGGSVELGFEIADFGGAVEGFVVAEEADDGVSLQMREPLIRRGEEALAVVDGLVWMELFSAREGPLRGA